MSQGNVAKRCLIHRSVSSYVVFQILIGYMWGGGERQTIDLR